MITTQATPEKTSGVDSKIDCGNDQCSGPDDDGLPCFECFDSTKDYGGNLGVDT